MVWDSRYGWYFQGICPYLTHLSWSSDVPVNQVQDEYMQENLHWFEYEHATQALFFQLKY